MKIGRNDLCPCGSGKKYKKCHLQLEEVEDQSLDESTIPLAGKDSLGYLVGWLSGHKFFTDLVDEFIKEVFGPDPKLTEEEFKAAMETIIFEGNLKGITPLQYFIENAPLTKETVEEYLHWLKHSEFTFFEVLSVQRGYSVNLRDLLSSREFLVFEHLGTLKLNEGMIIAARILPFKEDWVFSGGMLIPLPEQFNYLFYRTNALIKQEPISQTEAYKLIYGKKETNTEKFTYSQGKQKLSQEFKQRSIDLDVEIIDRIIQKKEKADLNKIYMTISKGCQSLADSEYLIGLFHQVYQSHPKFEEEKVKPGPKEQMLIQQLMFEAQQQYFKALAPKEAKTALNEFTKKWFKTPQKELESKTPEEIILQERKELGNPNNRLTYDFSVTKLPLSSTNQPNDEKEDPYNWALYQMNQKQDYYKALKLFSSFAERISEEADIFRYLCNVGVCLIQLGEMELGKKFFEKSLRISPDYQVAKNNLKNWQDPEIIEEMRFKGRQTLFFQILSKHLINFDAELSNNPMVLDFITFLTHLSKKTVTISKVKREISLPFILEINNRLFEPDPEEIKFNNGKKSFAVSNRKEVQFAKVNYLHNICLAAGWIVEKGNRLVLTKKGEEFLKLPQNNQFMAIFETFFIELNWAVLDRGDDTRADFLADQSEVLQNTTYHLLVGIKKLTNQSFSLEIMLKNAYPSIKGEQFETMFMKIGLEKLLVKFLVWSRILKDLSIKKETMHPFKILQDNDRFQLTALGHQVIEKIEEAMYQSIPSVFREIVNE